MTFTSVLTQVFCTPSFNPSADLPDLNGKVAIVTGSSAGLGKETARELARKGAHVFCIGRNAEKTMAVIDEISKETGNSKLEFIQGDFMDLKSVITYTKKRLKRQPMSFWGEIFRFIFWLIMLGSWHVLLNFQRMVLSLKWLQITLLLWFLQIY